MVKSISDWLAEGETLYDTAVSEYKELEAQLAELEEQMNAKLGEVNKLAIVIQRPTLEGRQRTSVTVVDRAAAINGSNGGIGDRTSSRTGNSVAKAGPGVVEVSAPTAFPASPRSIAQVLQGKGLDRP